MNNEDTTELMHKVNRGAELLDEKAPGWWRTPFNWEKFNITSVSHCLLSQWWMHEVGDIAADETPFHMATKRLGLSGIDYRSYGFDSNVMVCSERDTLKALWKAKVDERLAADAAASVVKPKLLFSDDERSLIAELFEAELVALRSDIEDIETILTDSVREAAKSALQERLARFDSILWKVRNC